MMTGYLHEAFNKQMTFEQFARLMARGMGFTILMRDDPLDVPLPEKFEPSDFYLRELEKAQVELAEWEQMSHTAKLEWVRAEKARRIEQAESALAEKRTKTDYLRGLLQGTEAWEIPQELEGMRRFMTQQLQESLKYNEPSYWEDKLRQAKEARLEILINEQEARLMESVPRYQQRWAEEQERTAERNHYLQMLRDSLETGEAK